MPNTMKQLQIVEPGKAEWRDAPVPQPGPGEVLVKVHGVTTCPQWDLHIMDGIPMFPDGELTYPYTPGQPGHEGVGEVVALGPGVTAPKVGTPVSMWRDPGHHRPGCYAQYAAFDIENLIEVPPGLPVEAIAPLELAMCVQVSFDQIAKVCDLGGARFGVSGLGPAGLVAIQMARIRGARHVVGIDPLPQRREIAARLGAQTVAPPDPQLFPADRWGDTALDAALDATGLKPSIEFLMDRTRQVVAIFGVLREQVEFGPAHWGGLALLGYGQFSRQAAQRALDRVLSGQLDLAALVTKKLPFTRYAEGVALLRTKQAVKICFLPWE